MLSRNRGLARFVGAAVVAGGLAVSQLAGVASAQQILPKPAAVDGQTLMHQPMATQRMFMDTWGTFAEQHWVAEHNSELLGLALRPDMTVQVAGVTVPGHELAGYSTIAVPQADACDPGCNKDGLGTS